MTKILEEAIAKAAQLPERMQDHLGAAILEEIDRNTAWDETLQSPASLNLLDTWASEALRDLAEGRTERLDPEAM